MWSAKKCDINRPCLAIGFDTPNIRNGIPPKSKQFWNPISEIAIWKIGVTYQKIKMKICGLPTDNIAAAQFYFIYHFAFSEKLVCVWRSIILVDFLITSIKCNSRWQINLPLGHFFLQLLLLPKILGFCLILRRKGKKNYELHTPIISSSSVIQVVPLSKGRKFNFIYILRFPTRNIYYLGPF